MTTTPDDSSMHADDSAAPQHAPLPPARNAWLTLSDLAKALNDSRPLHRRGQHVRSAPPASYMTVETLDWLCRQIFQTTNWKARLSDLVGVERSTVSRWCGGAPMPKWLAVTVWSLWSAHMHGAFSASTPSGMDSNGSRRVRPSCAKSRPEPAASRA